MKLVITTLMVVVGLRILAMIVAQFLLCLSIGRDVETVLWIVVGWWTVVGWYFAVEWIRMR